MGPLGRIPSRNFEQQLARTLYLSSHKNLLRKAKEALIARRLERKLTKERILELYLNVVEWGRDIYGAEAASQHFFGKPALDLTPQEAIALAAILPSPRKWNPLSEKKFMAERKSILYARMVRAGHIIPEPEPEIGPQPPESLEEPTTIDEIRYGPEIWPADENGSSTLSEEEN